MGGSRIQPKPTAVTFRGLEYTCEVRRKGFFQVTTERLEGVEVSFADALVELDGNVPEWQVQLTDAQEAEKLAMKARLEHE